MDYAGNIIFKIQPNKFAIIIDIVTVFKSFLTYYGAYIFFKKYKFEKKEQLIRYLDICCKIIVVPGFFLAILNLFVNVGMYTGYIYGLRAFHYIFLRVGNLNSICARILIILTLGLYTTKKDKAYIKKQEIYIFMTIVLMISTLRTRAFLYALIYIFGYFYFIKHKRLKIKIRYVVILLIIGTYIAIPKIQRYFTSNSTARKVLLNYGIETAINYYPIGSGFATYGTAVAQAYGSKLYDQYEFDRYYGLSEENGSFLTDNYWPAIMGQFGIFGMLLTFLIICNIFNNILHNTKNNNVSRFSALFGISSITVASLVSSSFLNTTSVVIMILIALATNYKNEDIGVKNENFDCKTITQ